MTTTVNKILNLARSWIGKKESNGSYKEIIDIYNAYTPCARNYKVKYTDSWCAVFISSLAIKCNAIDIIPLECSCGNMITLAKSMGIWQEDGSITPQAGYIVMYDWDKNDGWPEHVGIVESVSGNQFTVIEGNKSDAVGRRTVNVGSASIRGFIIPKYSGSSTMQPSQTIQSGNSVNYKVKVDTPSGVNCRKEPSTGGVKITAYANGTELTITKISGNWGYANNTGWVCLDYCQKITTSTISKPSTSSHIGKATGIYEVTAGALIVRTGPGTIYKRKSKNELTKDGQKHANSNGGLLKGTRVTVLKWSKNWAQIPSGWVSGDYLKKV